MGYDAECTIRYDGQTAKGKAVLEQKDLIFRGPFRLVVPLATVTRAPRCWLALGLRTDAVFLGAEAPADLERLAALEEYLQPAGAVWIVRRKGQTAVSAQASMAAGKKAGLVDVKVVSYSDTHTAEKYVIPVAARAGAGRSSPGPRMRGSASSRARN